MRRISQINQIKNKKRKMLNYFSLCSKNVSKQNVMSRLSNFWNGLTTSWSNTYSSIKAIYSSSFYLKDYRLQNLKSKTIKSIINPIMSISSRESQDTLTKKYHLTQLLYIC